MTQIKASPLQTNGISPCTKDVKHTSCEPEKEIPISTLDLRLGPLAALNVWCQPEICKNRRNKYIFMDVTSKSFTDKAKSAEGSPHAIVPFKRTGIIISVEGFVSKFNQGL